MFESAQQVVPQMYSLKPGRGPSLMAALGGVVIVFLALLMLCTVMPSTRRSGFSSLPEPIQRDIERQVFHGDARPALSSGDSFSSGGRQFDAMQRFGVIFLICFVGLAVAVVFYHLFNATARNRVSEFDITSGTEESDPVATALGHGELPASGKASDSERRFCPHCGKPTAADFQFCPRCGKAL
jgi:succinate dehydrogenase/fumarate reductase cytochrome b subunit